ncbi:nitroreductase family protein [uncultured Alistipes sp.]|jgi:nitroreductase|uniref:nitroreductase family protein n=1 Tax=Alistipes TaxID=239759 RepID=UPI00266BFC9A|nr:nitroreductase family protein [uncultured Alistipes sp.]
MNEVIENILSRRTIRHYKTEQIKEEELNLILQAGLYASTAGGRQSPVMLVCQNSEINERLGRINRQAFGHANSDGIHFVSQTQKSIADDDSIKSGFYGAPTVITLFAPTKWLYGVNDCTSVAVNMSLAAWSLGIGSCYVSRAEETFDSELGRKLMKDAGIGDEYMARVCLCFGYPEGDTGTAKPRKENRIKFIR